MGKEIEYQVIGDLILFCPTHMPACQENLTPTHMPGVRGAQVPDLKYEI